MREVRARRGRPIRVREARSPAFGLLCLDWPSEVIERDRKGGAAWTRFAFPTWWHYDVLRAWDYLRRAGMAPDERVAEAIELVASKRDALGRWPLETRHLGRMPVDTGEARAGRAGGTPSALRVLRWHEAGS
jgi:hypothetical protein